MPGKPTWNPTNSPTLFPTALPTPVPTFDLFSLWKIYISKSILSASGLDYEIPNFASRATYSELLVDNSTVGGCSDWNSFLNAELVDSRNMYYASVLQLITSFSLNSEPQSYVCSDPVKVNLILDAMTTKKNQVIPCNFHTWKFEVCNGILKMCIGCKNLCGTNPQSMFSPCGRQIMVNSFRIISVTFKQRTLGPAINEIKTNLVLKNLVQLIVTLSDQGIAYCGAFQTLPTSLAMIKIQGYQGYTNPMNQTALMIPNLAPATSYMFYCGATSSNGLYELSLFNVLEKSLTFRTKCCKSLNLEFSKSLIYSNEVIVYDFLTLYFEEDITNHMELEITIGCNNTRHDNTTIYPYLSKSLFQTSSSNIYSVTTKWKAALVIPAGVHEGQYNISINFLPTELYDTKYHQPNVFNIVGNKTSQVQPQLLSATFSYHGNSVIMIFDKPTDRGGFDSNLFYCNQMFKITIRENLSCQWIDSFSVLATMTSISNSTSLASYYVSILPNISINTQNSPSPTRRVSRNNVSSVVIGYPRDQIIPKIVVNMPYMISLCYAPIIDLSASDGSFSRPWKSFSVSIKVADGVNSTSFNVLNNYLAGYRNLSIPIKIPSTYFVQAARYTFYFKLCNVLNQCSERIEVMTVSNDTRIPSVIIQGAKYFEISRKTGIDLRTAIVTGPCYNYTASNIQYKWSVFSNNALQSLLISKSRQTSTFLLPAYSLTVGIMYTIKLTAIMTLSPYKEITDSVTVLIISGKIVPIVSGGSDQSIRSYEYFYLDASNSYDEDVPFAVGVYAGLIFSWTCTPLLPILSKYCPINLDENSLSSSELVIFADDAALGSKSSITLTVSDTTHSRATSYSISLSVLSEDYPLASIVSNSVDPKFDVSTTLELSANIYGSLSGSTATWGVLESNFNLSVSAVGPLQSVIKSSLSDTRKLTLRPNSLPIGLMLTFTFTLTTPKATIKSNINIMTNSPPVSGLFNVDPPTGHETETVFVFLAMNWIDEDLPLSFEFGYTSSSGQILLIKWKSEKSSASSYLPSGADYFNHNVLSILNVYDSLNAMTLSSFTVQVKPISAAHLEFYNALLVSSISSNSIDNTKVAVTLASTHLNKANCTMSVDCSKLNRMYCKSTSYTCGPCKSNYMGINGDSNTPCITLSQISEIRDTTSCISVPNICSPWGTCVNGKCEPVQKHCPNDCSGHGVCTFFNIDSGNAVLTCIATSSSCEAKCTCDDAYYSTACDANEQEIQRKLNSRFALIRSLSTLMNSEDLSDTVVKGWISITSEISYKTDEISFTSNEILKNISAQLLNGIIHQSLPYDSVTAVLDVINNIATVDTKYYMNSYSNKTSRALLSNIDASNMVASTNNLIRNFTDYVESKIVPGFDFQVIKPMFRLVSKSFASNLSYLSLPALDIELTESSVKPTVQFSSNFTYNSKMTMSLISIASNLYGSSARKFRSNPLEIRMSSMPCLSPPNCMVNVTFKNYNPLEKPSTQNFSTYCKFDDFSERFYTCKSGYVIKASCSGTTGLLVSNCPYQRPVSDCSKLVGLNSYFRYCYVINQTDSSTSCSCSLLDGKNRRKLDVEQGHNDVTFVSVVRYVAESFSETWIQANNPQEVVSKSWKVFTALGSMLLVVLISFALGYRSDKEHVKIVSKEEKALSAEEVVDIRLNYVSLVQQRLNMMEDALPSVLKSAPWIKRFKDEIKESHRWVSILFHFSGDNPRTYRITSIVTSIIQVLFIQSVMYAFTNPDDGDCENYRTEDTCLKPRNPIGTGNSNKCYWTYRKEKLGTCHFMQPSDNFQTILYVASFALIISIPTSVLCDYIMSDIFANSDNKINPSTVSKDVDAEFRTMFQELIQYRNSLSGSRKKEFEILWGLKEDQDDFFELRPNTDFLKRSFCFNLFGKLSFQPSSIEVDTDESLVLQSMKEISINSESEIHYFHTLTNDEKRKRLFMLFQLDLLTNSAAHASKKLLNITFTATGDARHTIRINKWHGWIIICLTHLGFVIYMILFAAQQSDSRQLAWIRTMFTYILLDIFLISTVKVYIMSFVLPMYGVHDMQGMRSKLNVLLHDFQQNILEKDLHSERKQMDNHSEPKFNAAQYFFLSHQVAKVFPDLLESQIILKYSTVAPNFMMQHEEVTDFEKVVSSHRILSACTRGIFTSSAIIVRFCLQSELARDFFSQLLATGISSSVVYVHMKLYNFYPVLVAAPALLLTVLFHFIYTSNRARSHPSQVVPITERHDGYDETKSDISQLDAIKNEEDITKLDVNMPDFDSSSGSDTDDIIIEDSDQIINMVNARIRELIQNNETKSVDEVDQLDHHDILKLVKEKCNLILKAAAVPPINKEKSYEDFDVDDFEEGEDEENEGEEEEEDEENEGEEEEDDENEGEEEEQDDEESDDDEQDEDSYEDVDEDDVFDQYSIIDDDELLTEKEIENEIGSCNNIDSEIGSTISKAEAQEDIFSDEINDHLDVAYVNDDEKSSSSESLSNNELRHPSLL